MSQEILEIKIELNALRLLLDTIKARLQRLEPKEVELLPEEMRSALGGSLQ